MLKYFCILFSFILTLFTINGLALTITYGDIVSFVLVPFFLNDLFRGRLLINKFSKLYFGYLMILLFSSILNVTFFEGPFLNIFKTNLFSLIYFIWIYSLLVTEALKLRTFFVGLLFLLFFFLVITWGEMQSAFGMLDQGFSTLNVFESSLNLNTWGFSLVLFLILSLFSWSKKYYTTISFVVSAILLFFIFFSYSRASYSLTLFIVGSTILYVNKDSVKKSITSFLAIILFYFINSYYKFVNTEMNDSAFDFFQTKTDLSAGYDDLVYMRFYIINIKPIIEKFSAFNFFQFFFGDAISIQHSIVSHVLIVSGLIGFIYLIKYYGFAIKYAFSMIKHKTYEAKFLLISLIAVFVNDFITNVSSFLPFSGYLSFLIFSFFFARININEV